MMGRIPSLPSSSAAPFVSGSSISHSSDTQVPYHLGHASFGTSFPPTPSSLPACPLCSALRTFPLCSKKSCTGLSVCLECPTLSPSFGESLLILQNQFKCQPLKGFPRLSWAECVHSFARMLRRIMLRSMNSAVTLPGLTSRLCYLLALGPCTK